MKRKVLFIINPVSGGKRKDKVPDLIQKNLDINIFEPTIVFTTGAMHASELAQNAVGNYQYVVAVGGDGTVNEIASSIVGTDTALGILPFGSGNGLARFLGIPMDTVKAIKTLNQERVEVIDSAKLNGQYFFNMAGMGFDAHISEVFSHDKTRGFGAYVRSAFREIVNYKSDNYLIEIDGAAYEREHLCSVSPTHHNMATMPMFRPMPPYRMGYWTFALSSHFLYTDLLKWASACLLKHPKAQNMWRLSAVKIYW